MLGFQALAAGFALLMLARHLPRALLWAAAVRRRREAPAQRDEAPGGTIVDVANVVLALAILAVAVKALAVKLIS